MTHTPSTAGTAPTLEDFMDPSEKWACIDCGMDTEPGVPGRTEVAKNMLAAIWRRTQT